MVMMLEAEGSNATDSATNKPAPALIPNSPASAKGLRVRPCMTAPARAKAAPVRQAANALGMRISIMILPMSDAETGCMMASARILMFPPAIPMQTEKASEKRSSRLNPIRTRKNDAADCPYFILVCFVLSAPNTLLLNISVIQNSICEFFQIECLAHGCIRQVVLCFIIPVIHISGLHGF